MKASEIIKNDGLVLIRLQKKDHIKEQPFEYDVKEYGHGSKRGWIYLDQFTKSAMRTVYNALSDKAKLKYDQIFITTLVNFTWKAVK